MNENLEAQIENATPELKAKISKQLQGLAQWQATLIDEKSLSRLNSELRDLERD